MQPKNNHYQKTFTLRMVIKWTKSIRSRQDSNLRGGTPLDFKSNALTTRPRLLICFTDVSLTISRFPSEYFQHRAPQPRLFDKKQTDAFTRQKNNLPLKFCLPLGTHGTILELKKNQSRNLRTVASSIIQKDPETCH